MRCMLVIFMGSMLVGPALAAPLTQGARSHGYAFAQSQLTHTLDAFAASNVYPHRTDAFTGAWETVGTNNWKSGFFPGQLWYMYAHLRKDRPTSAATFLNQAVRRTDNLVAGAIPTDHDIGVVTMTSWSNALRFSPDVAYRQAAQSRILAHAQTLSNRFKPSMQAIDSWNNLEEPDGVCIDNIMNLELLFKAHKLGGSQTFYDRAVAHARTSQVQHVRPDGGTYHVVRHNTDGSIERKNTRQGFGDESTWSRGQAWALYGYTMTYRFTRDDPSVDPVSFLATAQQTADYFINHLPANLDLATNPRNAITGDWVAPSDFNAEHGEPLGPWNDANNNGVPNQSATGTIDGRHYTNDRFDAIDAYVARDSSASAIAAAGLLELCTFAPDPTDQRRYFDAAAQMLESLLTWDTPDDRVNYLADGATGSNGVSPLHGILRNGSENYGMPNRSLIFGDYYFLEAMSRYEDVAPLFAVAERAVPESRFGFITLAAIGAARELRRVGRKSSRSE